MRSRLNAQKAAGAAVTQLVTLECYRGGNCVEVAAGKGSHLSCWYPAVDGDLEGPARRGSGDGIHPRVVAKIGGARGIRKQRIIDKSAAWPLHLPGRGACAVDALVQ